MEAIYDMMKKEQQRLTTAILSFVKTNYTDTHPRVHEYQRWIVQRRLTTLWKYFDQLQAKNDTNFINCLDLILSMIEDLKTDPSFFTKEEEEMIHKTLNEITYMALGGPEYCSDAQGLIQELAGFV